MTTNGQKRDAYQEITDRIVEALEKGVTPWVKPWASNGGLPHNAVSKRPYSGINLILLGFSSYTSQKWLTYNQAKAVGGQVRKGEHGTQIVFFKSIRVEDKSSPTPEEKVVPLLRTFTVFNVEQIDGLPEKFLSIPKVDEEKNLERNEMADAALSQATIHYGGSRACYVPSQDIILCPDSKYFKSAADFYATNLHELTHWSGHKSRLARDFNGRFGDASYAFEELIAELGAAFLCGKCGVDGQLQHASYIASWIKVLKGDKKAIFTASSSARKAADFLMPDADADEESEQEAA